MSRGPAPERPERIECLPVDGLGEVAAGADLARLLGEVVDFADGDILVVTSKVVSKVEGRVRSGSRETVLAEETDRVLARRGGTAIVRTHQGLVLAAAGIDASNVDPGLVVLLPRDPDASARRLREALASGTGRNVAVLVTDTAGRAWRNGQTDIAIGAAGLEVLQDYAGLTDPHGNVLAVTAPAVADELAAAADLVKRKLDRRPAAVVRGLAGLVLAPGRHGPGAATLVRDEEHDMFGLGAREAVLGALSQGDPRGFGSPCSAPELVAHLSAVAGDLAEVTGGDGAVTVAIDGTPWQRGSTDARVRAAGFALGWRAPPANSAEADAPRGGQPRSRVLLRFRPASP